MVCEVYRGERRARPSTTHPATHTHSLTPLTLTEAYEVLSEPKKREVYEAYGEDGLKNGFGGGQGGPQGSGGSFRRPEDIFAEVGGRGAWGLSDARVRVGVGAGATAQQFSSCRFGACMRAPWWLPLPWDCWLPAFVPHCQHALERARTPCSYSPVALPSFDHAPSLLSSLCVDSCPQFFGGGGMGGGGMGGDPFAGLFGGMSGGSYGGGGGGPFGGMGGMGGMPGGA